MRVSIVCLLALVFAALPAWPGENKGEKTVRILLIAKDRDHAFSQHEYLSDCAILAKCLNQTPGVKAEVVNGWPKEGEKFKDVKAIVLNTRLGGNVMFDPLNKEQAKALLKNGVGLTAIHWGTGADKQFGEDWLEAMGGWFNTDFSRYLVEKSKLRQAAADHPICRGWKDMDLRDEYYIQLKFKDKAQPILKAEVEKKDHVVGWTYERPQGGRSFGFVCGHFHDNFGETGFRKAIVNGILWTAGVEVPRDGAPVAIDAKDMELPPNPKEKKK